MATHSHEYDCIVCGAHFDNADDLDRHNRAEHISNAKGMEVPRQSDGRSGPESEEKRR